VGRSGKLSEGTLIGARDARAHHGFAAGFFSVPVLALSCWRVGTAELNSNRGWNRFSAQDDISLGKRAASDAEKQLPLCNAPKVDAYLTQLGTRLAQRLPTVACSIRSNSIA